MWIFKTLPFGWSYSPLLCQRLLAQLTGKVGLEAAGAVLRLMHYLDDFLVFGNSEAADRHKAGGVQGSSEKRRLPDQ